jgi:hypothetical protein
MRTFRQIQIQDKDMMYKRVWDINIKEPLGFYIEQDFKHDILKPTLPGMYHILSKDISKLDITEYLISKYITSIERNIDTLSNIITSINKKFNLRTMQIAIMLTLMLIYHILITEFDLDIPKYIPSWVYILHV